MACSASIGMPVLANEDVGNDLLVVLQALADPSRLKIMRLLREREQCVCHLTEALDVKQSTISHHMSVLKKAGLIVDRRDEKDARWVYYSLAASTRETGRRLADLLDGSAAVPTRADC
jgi:ArsR family transcriptional regulator